MLRRTGLLLGWAAATAAVVALGWGAVAAVTGAVTEPPPVAMAPVPTAAPSDDAEVPNPGAGAGHPSPPAQTSQPLQEEPGSRTFDVTGGTVGVRVGAEAVELLFATPRSGFAVDVRSRGPSRVDVRFSSDDHESRFRYDLVGGERVEERPQ